MFSVINMFQVFQCVLGMEFVVVLLVFSLWVVLQEIQLVVVMFDGDVLYGDVCVGGNGLCYVGVFCEVLEVDVVIYVYGLYFGVWVSVYCLLLICYVLVVCYMWVCEIFVYVDCCFGELCFIVDMIWCDFDVLVIIEVNGGVMFWGKLIFDVLKYILIFEEVVYFQVFVELFGGLFEFGLGVFEQ